MKLLLLFLLSLNLMAQDNYSLRVAYGKVTPSNLGDVLIGNIKEDKYDLYVLSLNLAYLLKEDIRELPIDIYSNIGMSYFDEDHQQKNIYEFVSYIKAYYKFSLFKNNFRFGFGEGISYTDKVLITEYLEANETNDHYSRFLNYLDISFDIRLDSWLFGVAIKHRSGIFGVVNNVSHGGSNYNTLYIEKRF